MPGPVARVGQEWIHGAVQDYSTFGLVNELRPELTAVASYAAPSSNAHRLKVPRLSKFASRRPATSLVMSAVAARCTPPVELPAEQREGGIGDGPGIDPVQSVGVVHIRRLTELGDTETADAITAGRRQE